LAVATPSAPNLLLRGVTAKGAILRKTLAIEL